jgi:CrcB protein
MLKNLLLVGFGGGVGAVMRYAISLLIKSSGFPMATFFINVVGSFILGMVMASTLNEADPAPFKLLLATGLCGGFTTFSAFAYENVSLFQAGKYEVAFLYILLSVVLCIGAAWIGFKIFQP